MDLQSVGNAIAGYRKRIKELEKENDDLRQLVEDLILSPGEYEYSTGKSHPLTDER